MPDDKEEKAGVVAETFGESNIQTALTAMDTPLYNESDIKNI